MSRFADIVFPTAVRHPFTYAVPEILQSQIEAGMRVWVPLQKHKSIGMIVGVHDRTPDFNTRTVEGLLDDKPVLSEEMLRLTRWISRFYYCGWGEAIQAALPVGLNFYSEKQLRVAKGTDLSDLDDTSLEIVQEVQQRDSYPYKEAKKRWTEGDRGKTLKRLISKKILEIREEPSLKLEPSLEKVWDWKGKVTDKSISEIIESNTRAGKKYKWVRALELLRRLDLPDSHQSLTENELLDSYTLNRIAREGVIESEEVESFDLGLRYDYDPSRLKQLNNEQQLALESILERVEEQRYASFLLYGITGSGKTEVYIHALREVLKQGRGGLVLVPEIGLTPQIIRRFYQVFGDQIAVLHSRLSNRERYNAWRALHMGEKRIAIGARSALFAPVPNLGLIVVDEEHDASYKQEDPAPRYHARDAAVMRASFNDAVVVMGSATPSMIALHGARKGKSELLSLGRRPLQAKLPEVHVVDLKQYRSAMKGPLAVPLYDAIGSALARDEQCILLYNRRGYAYFLQCEECGRIPECPNCSVSLTFHKNRNQLRCHYCGFSTRADEKCSECGGEIRSIGSGTQQLEEQIGDLFPNAETLRMDFDTTSGKNAHDAILSRFGRGEADLLVGTQIVGKGLDFPNVTVVGVIQADTELAFPSFRSGERLFQLLCQVAGRSGRGDKEGVVYFQTWQPDHPAIQAAKEHSYRTFAKRELSYRKSLNYPPFSRIIRFTFKGKQEKRVQKVAAVFTECLTKTGRNLPALGPSPATLKKVQQYYRWETLVKIPTRWRADAIEKLLDGVFESYEKIKPPRTSSVRINVNVDAME